jgi:outer membrane protein OmpA-like peptidoglycan-associated protein
MRYYLHYFIVLFLLYPSALAGQTDIPVHRKDFKVDEAGFEEAWKHVTEGDSYFAKGGVSYGKAFDEYLLAIIYNNSNPELNYKTGVSALFSDNKEEAAGFLTKAFDLKNDVAEDILLLTGRALQYSGKFSEAIGKLNDYINSAEKKSVENIALARKYIDECNSAMTIYSDTLRICVTNIGPNINSGSDDYSELITADGSTLYFASRKELPKSSSSYQDNKFDENIFISRKVGGSWNLAGPLSKNLTSKYCEAPLYINSTNDTLYIYAGYENNGDIKVSIKKKGEWKTPEKVPFRISSGGSETSFSISPSGREIYYITDNGKDNLGGKDIYMVRKIKRNKWSKPQNVGPVINTAYDEESVRFSKSGDTLWFSSKGHNSIGGFDIFYSIKNQAGEWAPVKNYGYPVNTSWDEIFYHPSPVDDSAFFFVSNRTGGFGGLDIYDGRLLPPKPLPVSSPDSVVTSDTVMVEKEITPTELPLIAPKPVEEPLLYLTGKVNDSETGEPVLAKIDVIDLNTNIVLITTASSDIDGSYRVRLPGKKSYLIDMHATGYLPDLNQIRIPDDYNQEDFKFDLGLIKVRVGKKVVLNNILFETGKSILTSDSYAELDRLFNILEDNPLMKIEISGHTDMTGSESLNLRLSEQRANAVVEYLIRKGMERSRMEFKGYGSTQPIADNATVQGRARNRRVEFKILEF